MSAKAKINLREGLVELEGSEEFVSKHLEHFKELVDAYKTSKLLRQEEDEELEVEEVKNLALGQVGVTEASKIKKDKKSKPSKVKSIDPEKFDYLKTDTKPALQDFLAEKKPGNTTGNVIAVIGYYIQHTKEVGYFTEGNVDFAYKILGIKGRPKHLRQIIINNKNQRDLFEEFEGREGTWKLTRAGEIFVDEQLPPKD